MFSAMTAFSIRLSRALATVTVVHWDTTVRADIRTWNKLDGAASPADDMAT